MLDETMLATAEVTSRQMTYEEWLEWDHDGIVEWVNGEAIVHMPPKHEHQRAVAFLVTLLTLFVKLSKSGLVQVSPFTVRLRPGGPAREPDLFFLATENRHRLTSQHLEGPADLVVEVISDDSVARDRADKFYEYQDAGVREYWIIDPRPGRERADFWVLDDQGRYQPVPVGDEGTYHSTVVHGFWLRIVWLWADETNPLTALAQIVGVERLIQSLHDND